MATNVLLRWIVLVQTKHGRILAWIIPIEEAPDRTHQRQDRHHHKDEHDGGEPVEDMDDRNDPGPGSGDLSDAARFGWCP